VGGGVNTDHTGHSGTGLVRYRPSSVEFSVSVISAGSKSVGIRQSNGWERRKVSASW
jgi:hypothetical protein